MIDLLRRMKKADKGILLVSILFIVSQVYFDMKIPELLSSAMNAANNTAMPIEQSLASIKSAALTMVLYVSMSFVLSAISSILIAKAVMSFITKLRQDVFAKVQKLSLPDVDDFTVSGLITRSTSDIMNVQTFVLLGYQAIIKAPIISVWALVKIGSFGKSWRNAVFVAIVFVLILVAVDVLLESPQIKLVQKQKDVLNKSVMEKLGGVDVIRAYNSQQELNKKFEGINGALSKALRRSQLPSSVMIPGINITLYLVSIFIYIVAIKDINSGNCADQLGVVSNVVAFIPYTAQLLLAFMLLVQVMLLYQGARVSSRRIREILNSKITVEDAGTVNTAKENKGLVEFKNVSFGYHSSENHFMKDLNFRCESGSTTAIIGAIGSGKTTLINLLMRFYDVSSGEILIDGVNIREYSLEALRDKISLTSQKAVLFTGSVESNIKFGNDEKDGPYEIGKTCEIAGAKEFLDGLEEGYDAKVLKHGTNFSGGQRQRLSIARTLSKPCEILVFDDSFSALDYKTERMVRKQILENYQGVTKIIVSQRISTIRDADQIIVMDNGSIKGIGTHDQLLQECRDYQEIYASQNSDEKVNESGLQSGLRRECHA